MDDFGYHSQFEGSFRQVPTNDNKKDSAGKLFVGGVSWGTTEDVFADYFSQFGEILDSVLMIDRYSGRPRGFGFVTFADPAIADQVLEKTHVIDGRAVEVKETVPREEMRVKNVLEMKKIFVGGMPALLTEDDLEEYFSSYGKTVELQIMVDHITGRSRGFGFVTFETADAVEKVLSRGKTHELGGKQVEIKKAEPRRHGDYSAHGRGSSGRGGYSSRVQHDEKIEQGYSGYGGGYDYYGGYGGSHGGNTAGFYCGYGGYGYGYGHGIGFGFVNPMYGGGYGVGGYGIAGSHGGNSGFETGAGGFESRGNGSGGGGVGGGSREIGRFHPYRKQ